MERESVMYRGTVLIIVVQRLELHPLPSDLYSSRKTASTSGQKSEITFTNTKWPHAEKQIVWATLWVTYLLSLLKKKVVQELY